MLEVFVFGGGGGLLVLFGGGMTYVVLCGFSGGILIQFEQLAIGLLLFFDGGFELGKFVLNR